VTQRPYPEVTRVVEDGSAPVPWEVRVTWAVREVAPGEPMPGVECVKWSHIDVMGESAALDRAVSILDGCKHPDAPVRAVRAEIRRTRAGDEWRTIGTEHVRARSYF
jgi:hypothetical protein